MKVNQFFNKILNKWPVKVCCLIIAICLYLFHQASLTDKRSFVLPVQLEEEGGVIHIGDYTNNVTVTVRANTEQISSVHSSQLNAYVSLDGIAKSGEYTLPVRVKVADEIRVFDPFEIKVKPEYIKIRVENKDLKSIPIEPVVNGTPEHGYELTSVIVNPQFVEVTGPESIIKSTQKVYTEIVDITDTAKKESFTVNLRPLNKILTITKNTPVEVTCIIEPMQMEREFENYEVNVTGLNEKFYLEEGTPVINFTLSGTVPVLENYTPTQRFAVVDLRGINEEGEYEIPVSYSVPSYLTLQDGADESVHVKIVELKNEIQSEAVE